MLRRRRRRGRGRNSRSDRRSLWLVKENEPAGQVLLARIHEGKERTSFFRVSFLSIRRDEGHRIRASALSHTSRRSPRAWTVGKLHGAHRFRICRGLGLLFILLLFFSPPLSLFSSFLFYSAVEHDAYLSTKSSTSTTIYGIVLRLRAYFPRPASFARFLWCLLKGGVRTAQMARGFSWRVTLTRNGRESIYVPTLVLFDG